RSAQLEQGNELQLGEILFRLMHDDVVADPDDVTQWTIPASVSAAGESGKSARADVREREPRVATAPPASTGMMRPASNGNGVAGREPASSHLVPRPAYGLAAQEALQGALSVLTTLETRLGDLTQ